jgi:acyl-CoA hydrolase
MRGCSDKGDRSGNLAAEFETEITVITPPSDANPEEDVFGGLIVKHVHLTAVLLENVIFGSNVVTAGIDRATFLKLVFIRKALLLKGILNYVIFE